MQCTRRVLDKIAEICAINIERQYKILNDIMFPLETKISLPPP